MEIRRVDGRIDEIVASGASVHLEDMGENGWYLRIEEGEWTLFESSED